jgi:hypothetical protein
MPCLVGVDTAALAVARIDRAPDSAVYKLDFAQPEVFQVLFPGACVAPLLLNI